VQKAGIRLFVDLQPALPPLATDLGKLRQTLSHLLSNAVKFSRPGGEVHLAVSRANGGYCRFVVTDHGIGMRPEDIPLALAPFSQVDGTLARKYDGAGLGLSLATRFVELMGGTLTIDSAPDRGTTVTILVPGIREIEDQAA
jgi:signal transduction histidine kinase